MVCYKQMERRIPTFEERLREVVNISYRLLCEKIVGQDISIHNEASMQLHLSVIIKQIGVLYELSSSERFSIELESYEEIESTQKSSNGKARCDIKIKLYDQITQEICTAFIELKYKSLHTSLLTFILLVSTSILTCQNLFDPLLYIFLVEFSLPTFYYLQIQV